MQLPCGRRPAREAPAGGRQLFVRVQQGLQGKGSTCILWLQEGQAALMPAHQPAEPAGKAQEKNDPLVLGDLA